MTRLFRMPNSLDHFHMKGMAYIKYYAKGLCESCKQIDNFDYSVIFLEWIDDFHPHDDSKVKNRLEDWTYIKGKLFSLVKIHALNKEQLSGEIGFNTGVYYVGDESMRLKNLQTDNSERFLNFNGLHPHNPHETVTSAKAKRYFAESYNMCVGLDEYAKQLGYECFFLTMTAPKEMHSNPKFGGNTWDKTTAKQSHEYLAKNWKKFINDFSRKKYNIKLSKGDVFGCRSVEPNCDGTPHWHVLIYSSHENLHGSITDLAKKHFGQTCNSLKIIDCSLDNVENRRTPTTYLIKYLEGVNLSDTKSIEKMKRITAWKSALGIRSFQRFGKTASTTHWRLFRKLHSQWMNGELTIVYERNKEKIQINLRNRLFSLAYNTMIKTFTSVPREKSVQRRQFTEFINAVKKLEETGHDVLIKEIFDNKYEEEKNRVAGFDFGNVKYIFKKSSISFS